MTRTSRERMNPAPRSMDVCIRGDLGSNAGSSISISLPAVTRILGDDCSTKTEHDLDPVNEHDEPFAAIMFHVYNRQPIIAVVADAVSFYAADNVDSKRIRVCLVPPRKRKNAKKRKIL